MSINAIQLNPWFTIWFAPRATIRKILNADSIRHVMLLIMLTSFVTILGSMLPSPKYFNNVISAITFLFLATITALLYSSIIFYIVCPLLRWTGSWFGGKATTKQVRIAYAWSSIPFLIWYFVIGLPYLFFSIVDSLEVGSLIMTIRFITIFVTAWSFIVHLKCLGEAHQFSFWRAYVSFSLFFLIFISPLAVIVVVIFSLM